MPKITWLMRGKAKAGTQIHGPPQTHMPNITPGIGEPEKYNKCPALKDQKLVWPVFCLPDAGGQKAEAP